jgi:hypothetical protein
MNLTRSLAQLERLDLGGDTDGTHLVKSCHRLWQKPIGQFEVEDLRIMIGQSLGLRHLVPLALAVLERDPLAAGDFFPGDLLCSLLRADPWYWQGHVVERAHLERIVGSLASPPPEVAKALAGWR